MGMIVCSWLQAITGEDAGFLDVATCELCGACCELCGRSVVFPGLALMKTCVFEVEPDCVAYILGVLKTVV